MTVVLDVSSRKTPLIAHGVGFYFPENTGGTEVYVQDLCVELLQQSLASTVIAATDLESREYVWNGVNVLRYPSDWGEDERKRGVSNERLSKFQNLVLERRPDIFHLHSWTRGSGLIHLAQVAQLGIPCVVTVHVPSPICMRGTMLLHGRQPCDGKILEQRCSKCWAESRGLPRPLAYLVSRLPQMPSLVKIKSRGATLMSARSLASAKARELHQMSTLCKQIVVPSQWVYDALVTNGIPPAKLTLLRQEVGTAFRGKVVGRSRRQSKILTIGFAGRLERYKGLHTLVDAMARIPHQIPIRLLIAGTGADASYARYLLKASTNDKRIELCGPKTHEQIAEFMTEIDVLAVPSNYMETGPLVVLEAYAAGLPVLGANLGGIAERIRDGEDGLLLPFNDSTAWAGAMIRLVTEREFLNHLSSNVRSSRSMKDVASEMASLYRQILQGA